MSISFRHSAGFGKRMEYKLIGDMLMEGLDCYTPLVDDHGVDCVIKKSDGTFIEIQIKLNTQPVGCFKPFNMQYGLKRHYNQTQFSKA